MTARPIARHPTTRRHRVARAVVLAAVAASVVGMAGCAGPSSSAASDTQSPTVKRVPSDATPTQGATTVIGRTPERAEGELFGRPAPGSKFARLAFGMTPQQVMNLIGAPSDSTSHETGKRWIPFYFGPDARRSEVLYRGEGCLTYTGGNLYGSGSNELIRIEVDPSGKCFDS